MDSEEKVGLNRVQKWGWVLMLAVSAMLMLNGAGWFFMGSSLATFEGDTGVPLTEFREAYPTVAHSIAVNARQVAIWFLAFGSLAFGVALEAFRSNSPSSSRLMWILIATPAAIGINVFLGGQSPFAVGMLGVAAIALLGQLLTRPSAKSSSGGTTSSPSRTAEAD